MSERPPLSDAAQTELGYAERFQEVATARQHMVHDVEAVLAHAAAHGISARAALVALLIVTLERVAASSVMGRAEHGEQLVLGMVKASFSVVRAAEARVAAAKPNGAPDA